MAPPRNRDPRRLRSSAEIFGMPMALAAASIVGLLSALFDDGVWDALSWLMLGATVAVILYYMRRRAG